MADFWQPGDKRPIHLKEAEALLATLRSVQAVIAGHRVDAYVDNVALLHAWGKQGCRDIQLARILKSIFKVVTEVNVDLNLHYVPSAKNPADAPSRSLSWADAMLGEEAWSRVEQAFGPHSVDLMATDTNAMCRDGVPLKHFTPHPTPHSAGTNLFAQDLSQAARPYCYPPICLIGPLLRYLRESGVECCTVVVPDMSPRPVWWPELWHLSQNTIVLGQRGQKGVLHVPTKQGYVRDAFGLRWGLLAHDMKFVL